jgi:demethylspheroidene O-methyltransferase
MAARPGAEPMGDAYFGFYLLAMGRGGRAARRADGHAASRPASTGAQPAHAAAAAGRVLVAKAAGPGR